MHSLMKIIFWQLQVIIIINILETGVEPPYKHSSAEDIIGCAGTIFLLDLPPK